MPNCIIFSLGKNLYLAIRKKLGALEIFKGNSWLVFVGSCSLFDDEESEIDNNKPSNTSESGIEVLLKSETVLLFDES